MQSGKIEFDRCIATPDVMPLIGRIARVRCGYFCLYGPIASQLTGKFCH